MKKCLLLTFVLALIMFTVKVSAWTDCTPSNCGLGYTDNGIYCIGGTCYRNCTAQICTGNWTQVHDDFSRLDDNDESLVSDSTSSYTPTNTYLCYRFLYDSPDDNHIIAVTDPPSGDCDVEIIGGFYDATSMSDPWFKDLTDYLGDVEGTQYDYLLTTYRAHCQEDFVQGWPRGQRYH